MFCEACHQRNATVHLVTTERTEEPGQQPITRRERHFCAQCADNYFASTPEMNSVRGLICLSDSYRSRLYDLLEAAHPQALDNTTEEACQRGSELMQDFLREHLKKDKIEVNEDAFGMLCQDFFCSDHFYNRMDAFKRKRG